MPVGSSFWIADGMLAGEIEHLGAVAGRSSQTYRFPLRNQFLHGHHPLGWIRDLQVAVDDVIIDPDNLFFVLRDQWVGARQVPTISDIWWQMGETAFLAVRHSGGMASGVHAVEVTMTVSSLNHTPIVDHKGLYPTVVVRLSAQLPVALRPPTQAVP